MSCQIKLLAAQANKQSTASNVICCLQIPNKLLYLWKLESKTCPLLENLNSNLSSMHIPLQLQSSTSKSSFHQRLVVRCSDLYHRAARLSRRKRESLLQKNIIISVRHSDVVQLSSLQEEVRLLENKVKNLEEAVVSNDVTISHLVKQLDIFTQSSCFQNKGKAIDEVEDRQRRRKITQLRESCKLALWFADSFNIDLLAIYFQVKDSNDTIQLQYKDSCVASSATNLSTTTKEILYLLDRFAVSDELYHELSMICPSLPRSHIIRKLRTSISNNVEIIRLPTPYFGAYRPIIPAIKSALQTYIEIEENDVLSSILELKFGGDGAPFCRTASYILLSFSFPSLNLKYSHEAIHTFAALRGKEAYDVMKNGFAPVLIEINELIENGAIEINGTSVKLNIYFGGDYKFLLSCMGLNAANSNYACIYCSVHKSNRWDVSVPKETYLKDKRRTLPQIVECSKQKMSNLKLGVLNQPLIKIDLEQIIPDELHLMLRITDVLLRNLIYAAASKDSSVIQSNETTLNLLIQIIRDCGVTFHVWYSKEKKDNLEWTSLRGTDKKKLLQKLPLKIPEVISDEGLVIMKLWEDFNFIYSLINESDGKESDIEILEKKAKQWIQDFLSIKLDGHQRANITPYMHLMVYHIPHLMGLHQGIKRFTGQGLEKKNDVARRNYFSSNHLDAPKEILVTDARLHMLSPYKRSRHTYNKKDEDYWSHKIYEKRARKADELTN